MVSISGVSFFLGVVPSELTESTARKLLYRYKAHVFFYFSGDNGKKSLCVGTPTKRADDKRKAFADDTNITTMSITYISLRNNVISSTFFS